MNILIVGNVLKDVYLGVDTRVERAEMDKNGTPWVNLGFDASRHEFFSRTSSFGGAAVTLEVLQKMGLNADVAGSKLNFVGDEMASGPAAEYRYILTYDDNVSYLVPSEKKMTDFVEPAEVPSCIYVDRSAEFTETAVRKLAGYLDAHPAVELVLYVRPGRNAAVMRLLSHADLVFLEKTHEGVEELPTEIANLPAEKVVTVYESELNYADVTVQVNRERIDTLTHLSAYSIGAATVLGGFLLGYSVDESLKMGKLNLENATLNSTLSLAELQELLGAITPTADELELMAANLVMAPKGILAADESGGSIEKKFAQLGIENTFENRHVYRDILLSLPELGEYVNGVILFDETARDLAANGQTYVDNLTARRIIPGIKVDQGLEKMPDSEETYTKGLDGLAERLREYYMMGLRFAKWRAAFELKLSDIGEIVTPSDAAIAENCRILAKYAKACQAAGLVPIVEPEVVYDGYYTIEKCAEATGRILDKLFSELRETGVNLRACVLKVNMVMAGKQMRAQSSPNQVGKATAQVLRRYVPAELAGVVFLSGGQTPEQATANLAAVMKQGPFPWPVTFSFARALQDPALFTWKGLPENVPAAKKAFRERLDANKKVL